MQAFWFWGSRQRRCSAGEGTYRQVPEEEKEEGEKEKKKIGREEEEKKKKKRRENEAKNEISDERNDDERIATEVCLYIICILQFYNNCAVVISVIW